MQEDMPIYYWLELENLPVHYIELFELLNIDFSRLHEIIRLTYFLEVCFPEPSYDGENYIVRQLTDLYRKLVKECLQKEEIKAEAFSE